MLIANAYAEAGAAGPAPGFEYFLTHRDVCGFLVFSDPSTTKARQNATGNDQKSSHGG